MLSPSGKKLLLSMTPLVVCLALDAIRTPVFAQAEEGTEVIDKAAQRAAARKAWLIKKAALDRAAAAKAARLKAAQAASIGQVQPNPAAAAAASKSPARPAAPAVQAAVQQPAQSLQPTQALPPSQSSPPDPAQPIAEPPAKRVPMAGSQAAREAARALDAGGPGAAGDGTQATTPDALAVKPKPRPVPHFETLKQAQHEAATKSGAGDYLGAIAAWTRFTQHSNQKNARDMSHAYLERARLKRHLGDHAGALQDLDLTLQIEPRNVSGLLERAAIKRRQGDNHGALKDLDMAIVIEPHKADPYVDRGWLKMAMGDYVGSYGDYHAAITIDPSLKNKLAGMAQPQVSGRIDTDPTGSHEIEFSNNDFKHVEKHQSMPQVPHPSLSAPNLSQTALVHLNNMAVKQINDGQFEEAIKTLTYLLSSAPDYHHALENLCIAHNNWGLELAKRTPVEAASQFRLALYLDPSQNASRRNLNAMLKEVGKDPHQADVRMALCRELLSSGQKEEAFVEAMESLKLKNDTGARNVMRQVLSTIDSDDGRLAGSDRQPPQKPPSYHPAGTADSANSVLEQARALSAAGQHVGAEELLVKLIGDIKARAAVEETGDVGNLEKALATIAEVYQKAGDNYQAQKYRIELASLKETLNSTKEAQAPPAALLSSPTGN